MIDIASIIIDSIGHSDRKCGRKDANVLFVLGMAERLGDLADVRTDVAGLELEEERLPQRIRNPRRSGPQSKELVT